MKLLAQDSDKLLVLEGIKRRGLFSWVLPRMVGILILAGLTLYGFFGYVAPTIINLLWK